MLLRPFLRQFERILEHAIDAVAPEGRGLHHRLPSAPFENSSADRGVLSLGIFAHHRELDIANLSVGQRRLDPRHKADGPQIDIKVELAAHRNEQLPQRNMIRHTRKTAGAEKNRVVMANHPGTVFRHHATVLSAIFAAPREFIPIEKNIKLASRSFEDSETLRERPLCQSRRPESPRSGRSPWSVPPF
jgi:hypothetical protein